MIAAWRAIIEGIFAESPARSYTWYHMYMTNTQACLRRERTVVNTLNQCNFPLSASLRLLLSRRVFSNVRIRPMTQTGKIGYPVYRIHCQTPCTNYCRKGACARTTPARS